MHTEDMAQMAPEFSMSTLPFASSTFSIILPEMLTRMVPVVIDYKLTALFTVLTQRTSQDALKYATQQAPKYTSNGTQ
jgi:hypothetical protein